VLGSSFGAEMAQGMMVGVAAGLLTWLSMVGVGILVSGAPRWDSATGRVRPLRGLPTLRETGSLVFVAACLASLVASAPGEALESGLSWWCPAAMTAATVLPFTLSNFWFREFSCEASRSQPVVSMRGGVWLVLLHVIGVPALGIVVWYLLRPDYAYMEMSGQWLIGAAYGGVWAGRYHMTVGYSPYEALGLTREEAADYHGAEAAYLQGVQVCGSDRARRLLARLLLHLGRHQEARHVLEEMPSADIPLALRVALLASAGNEGEARGLLDTIERGDTPSPKMDPVLLGFSYEALHDVSKARDWYRKAGRQGSRLGKDRLRAIERPRQDPTK